MEVACEGGLLTSLGDWFWEAVFRHLSLSERAAAELVCKRWYSTLREWIFWGSLGLCQDSNMSGKWSTNMLDQLVLNSMGARSSPRNAVMWPCASPIKYIDMNGCGFRAVSPLRLLDLLRMCPNLEVLKLSGVHSSLTGTSLPFHSKDFEYVSDVICTSGRKLQSLEMDLRVQSSWSVERQAKWLDPASWGHVLEWLAWEETPVDIRKLEIMNVPNTVWDVAAEPGEFFGEMSAVEENLSDLGNALCMNYFIEELVFGPECQLGQQGAIHLMQMIKYNMSLSCISLCSNGITSEAVRDMARALLRDGPPLLKIDLRGNSVEESAVAALEEAMKRNMGFDEVGVIM